MQYIFLDLEAVGSHTACDFQEIIEIAAYKVRPVQILFDNQPALLRKIVSEHKQYGITQEFHSYVHPIFHKLNKKVSKLTHIDASDLEAAPYFYEVMESFKKWVGDEDTSFIAWSKNDRRMLGDNAKEHYINLFWITNHYIDLQNIYDDMFMNSGNTNLMKALQSHGIYFRGIQHNALDDSFNTYMLFHDLPNIQNRL